MKKRIFIGLDGTEYFTDGRAVFLDDGKPVLLEQLQVLLAIEQLKSIPVQPRLHLLAKVDDHA